MCDCGGNGDFTAWIKSQPKYFIGAVLLGDRGGREGKVLWEQRGNSDRAKRRGAHSRHKYMNLGQTEEFQH